MPRDRTGNLELRGGIWHARLTVYVDGRRTRPRYSLETADESTAQRKLEKLLRAVPPVGEAPRVGPLTFKDWADAWIAKREHDGVAMFESERGWLNNYARPVLDGLLLGDVGPKKIAEVLERVIVAGCSKQTVQHVRATLGRCFGSATAAELIESNPVEKVRTPKDRRLAKLKKQRTILRDDEIMRLVAREDVDLEIRVAALASRVVGGMRTRDLTAWDWTDIELPGMGACVVPRTKTLSPQRLEIPDVLQPSLRAWWEQHGRPTSGPMFPVTKGKRKGEARKTRGVSFAKRLRRALFKAGVMRLPPVEVTPGKIGPDSRDPLYFETATSLPVDFHSGRRAFRTALERAGVDTKTAMRLGGWDDERAAERYNMRGDETLRIPAAALPAMRRSEEDGIEVYTELRRRRDGTTGSSVPALRTDRLARVADVAVQDSHEGAGGGQASAPQWTHERARENDPLITFERDTGFEPATLSLGSWRTNDAAPGFAEKSAGSDAIRGASDRSGSRRVIRQRARRVHSRATGISDARSPTRRRRGHTFVVIQGGAATGVPVLPASRRERRVALAEALLYAERLDDVGAARLLWSTLGISLGYDEQRRAG